MGDQTLKNKKIPLSTGLVAHVDAGKTTLSEAILYTSGARRTLGRVDHGDAFLDTHALERARGITIFSKQAVFETETRCVHERLAIKSSRFVSGNAESTITLFNLARVLVIA